VASQLFAAYSKVKQVRNLSSIIGEEELSEGDKRYLQFGEKFEQAFLTQGETENRSIGQTLDLGWKVLAELPREELLRVNQDFLDKYLG
jgi:V/A-type H+-transporting ATPase subunit B